ncbi:BppU family phage baseplate upper protein [Hungatella effluvii]|uniref:BppU family phage baseplate upper protein n=1 Tax=Hungatella effluvii TaxID=1096246 RepID=UPI002A82D47A|nr:BppU family phage baseplate upper protein [Hungatella effluvii]
MDGTIQNYTLDMAADTKKEPLRVKQYDTNSRQARITLKMGGEPWTIPFGCQIHINVRKTDGTLADAACTRIDEHTVLTPITEQMTAVTGTQLGELYFLGSDGDIKSQSFPVVVYEAVMDQARMESSDDFQSLQDALRDVKASTDTADIAAQYATEQGNSARDAARQAENAAGSIQAAVDAAAAAKVSETNAKTSETASAQTKQEVTDYVEAQKAAFVGYSKRESDSRYANALTNSVTGEGGVTVEDAWTAPVLGLDVVGKSEQATTTGAQLLPQPQFNDTKNGITVKTQMDGGISITGTATSAIAFTVAEILLPAGTYILSGLSGLVVGRMYFQLVEISAQGGQFVGELAKVGPVAGATVTIDRDVWARAEIKVLSGVTADSICYPMLNAGDTALPWEPYTGGAPSPSPDYPQDIISTGTVSTGKQMLNADTIVQGMVNAETGALSVTPSFVSSDFIPVKPGDYVLSGEGIKPYLNYVIYFDKEKVIKGNSTIKSSNGKFTVTEGIAYARLRFVSKTGAEGTVTPSEVAALKPMLNAGDTALPWEPYTGGKPSPSVEYPQEVKVTATGGNLFNASKIKTMSAWGATVTNNGDGSITVSGSGVLTDYINQAILFTRDQTLTILGAGNYCMSGKKTYPYFYFTLYDTVEKKVVFEINTKATPSKEITQKLINNENVVLRIGFYGEANTQIIPGVVCPMVNAGDSALPWAPYQSTSATITLTEPLRGIGEYRDRIMCRDGVWGIERWITKLTLDGSEDWVIYGNSSYISFYTQSVCLPVSMNKREGLCEQLRVMTIGGKNLNTIWLGANNKVVYAIDNQFYNDTLEDKGLANWKAHLAESPLEIITYLDAPTWEPLPAATQQALNALTTYAGTTHLTITAGGPAPEVTLEYVQDTQKAIEQHDTANRQYTDNQIAAIVAALPTATQAAIVDNQTTKLLQEV